MSIEPPSRFLLLEPKIILFGFSPPIISSIVRYMRSKRIELPSLAGIFDTRVLNFANQLPFRSSSHYLLGQQTLEIKGGEGRGLNGSANCRMGHTMLDPDPFPPPNAFFSLSLLGPVPLHANPCFLGTNFSIHLVKKGQKGGC